MSTSTQRRSRLTIGRLMVAIAVFAGLLALPRPRETVELAFAASVLAVVPVLLITYAASGFRCPGCASWTLRRLARFPRYYACSSCRGRFKRSGFGTWLDASGPEDDATYRGKARSRPWLGYVVPEDSSDTTPGSLLREKRRRGPWGHALGLSARAISKAFAGDAKTEARTRERADFDDPRRAGETTTGVLLRSKERRQSR